MKVYGEKILAKLKIKNRGNSILRQAIDRLVIDLETLDPSIDVLKNIRKDANCVYDGVYFFDLHVHRTLIMINFNSNGNARIIWAGSHREYEITFRNNKSTIEKWLRNQGFIK